LEIKWPKHRLSLGAKHTPSGATEGEEFVVRYSVQNIGDEAFPGGHLTILLSWPSQSQPHGITDILDISQSLSPGSQFSSERKRYTALLSGYTVFQVINATATDEKPVEIYFADGHQLWPSPHATHTQIFHAVRVRSHEEINQRKAVRIVLYSLVIIAVFQVAEWLLRYFLQL
jgi:hypothetical protein